MILSLAVGVPLFGALSACGERPVTARFQVFTREASAAEVAETARVLALRFEDFSQSWSSNFVTSVDGNRIDFEFHGESPGEDSLRYLGATRGVYRLGPEGGSMTGGISDLDFAAASCVKSDYGVVLATQLKPDAGEKMLAITRRNVGKVLITTWDAREVSRATVQGVFGARFQSPVPESERIQEFCTVIEHGRLPVWIERVEYTAVN